MTGLAIGYFIWAVLVFGWWCLSSPESAPQQAALAAQALVLAAIPYMIVSSLQRVLIARDIGAHETPITRHLPEADQNSADLPSGPSWD